MKFLLNLLWRSMRGEEHDYTNGSLPTAVILLAIPMIMELGLESVFAVVDIFFVSKLGPNAIASVGLTESVITLVYALAIGLSTAATALVARRMGEQNAAAAGLAGAQALIVGVAIALALSLLGLAGASHILALMGASPEVIEEGSIFTQIMLGGSIPIVLLFLINGIFRGAGDAAMAMKSLWLASGVNIVLCPLFIHLFGLKGAAIATVIGRSSGVIYQGCHLIKSQGRITMYGKDFRLQLPILSNLCRIAWPATLQFILGSGSWIILTRLIAETGGTYASAGYQIAFRNFVFFILPAWGLSNAAATLVGQNLGADRPDRAEQSVLITAKFSGLFMAIVSFIFFQFAKPITEIFTSVQEVVIHGETALKILGSGFIFYGVGMVFSAALNGAGDTKTPTWINFICFWTFQTPLAYLLAKGFHLGAMGAAIAIPVAQAALTLASAYVFKRARWKSIKI